MAENRQIDASPYDTQETDLGDLSSWTDPDTTTTYSSTAIPWCLMQALVTAVDEHQADRPANETVKVWLSRETKLCIVEALQNHGCAGSVADAFEDPNDWTVVVCRSQSEGTVWGEVTGEWFAHPAFLGDIVAGQETSTDSWKVLSITSAAVL